MLCLIYKSRTGLLQVYCFYATFQMIANIFHKYINAGWSGAISSKFYILIHFHYIIFNFTILQVVFNLCLAQIMSLVFYCGYFNHFIVFFKVIRSGGCGKNGSTIAVRLYWLPFYCTGVGLCIGCGGEMKQGGNMVKFV